MKAGGVNGFHARCPYIRNGGIGVDLTWVNGTVCRPGRPRHYDVYQGVPTSGGAIPAKRWANSHQANRLVSVTTARRRWLSAGPTSYDVGPALRQRLVLFWKVSAVFQLARPPLTRKPSIHMLGFLSGSLKAYEEQPRCRATVLYLCSS